MTSSGKAAIAAASAICAGQALAGITYRVVALSGEGGQYGPDQGSSVFTALNSAASINDNGQVLFRGDMGAGVNGLWLNSGGVNTVRAIAGAPMPGGGTYASNSIFNSYGLNNNGNIAMRLGASTGIFGDDGSGMGRLGYTGDVAMGTGGATHSSIASGMPLMNASGQIAYLGSLTTGTGSPPVITTAGIANGAGLWVGGPGVGNQSLVLRQNDSVLSLDGSGAVRVGGLTSGNLTMSFNNNGKYAIQTVLQGTVVTGNGVGANANSILTNRTGSLSALARSNDVAPDAAGGMGGTDLYRSFSGGAIGLNNLNHVAFQATLKNAAGTQTSTGAFYTDTGTGTLRAIARQGTALPTITSMTGAALTEFNGVTWGAAFDRPAINNVDNMAFITTGMGNTGATNNTGAIMTYDTAGNFHKVARSGDVAVVGGAPLGGDAFFLSFGSLAFNDAGQLAFGVNLTGAGVSVGLGNGSALFAADTDGTLYMLARTGDNFTVGAGDVRVVSSISSIGNSGGGDGRTMSLNQNGYISFGLDFSNGTSGVFVAHVPAPTTISGFGLAMLMAARRRRR